MSKLEEQTFSVMDPKGLKTIAFVIENDFIGGEEVLTLRRLDVTTEEDVTGKNKRKFAVKTDKDLTVLMLTLGKDKVVLNTGLFSESKVKIVQKPSIVKYEPIQSKNDEPIIKEFKYTDNFKRPIAIIDVETGDEVIPTVYLNQDTGDVIGKCKMIPYRPYVALELTKKLH